MKKRLVILGAGESGVGTAILGKSKNYDVFVSEKGLVKEHYKNILIQNNIAFEEGKHSEELIFKADIVMKSPGIPEQVALVERLVKKGVPIVSEIEFAAKYTTSKVIGVTGSNGKTTTTMLIYHLLKKMGLNVGVAGNIGDSFAKQIAEKSHDIYVLELSSFQLDGIHDFSSDIAVLTNIIPDHLDRYNHSFDNYIESKFRITKNQKENDFLIYNKDDKVIVEWLNKNKTKAKLVPFSIKEELAYGAFLRDQNIIIKFNSEEVLMNVSNLKLQGKHNTKNAMASAMAARLLKARKSIIAESLCDFEGVEHRLENVLKINGVQYVNDSKATNVNAAYYALECMDTPTVWIVGGVDKGNDYTDLLPLVREKVKAIICLGLDNSKIVEIFQNVVDIMVETAGAEEAVKVAHKIAEKGDTVLLSPACASFDLFSSYEDRGDKFKEAVAGL